MDTFVCITAKIFSFLFYFFTNICRISILSQIDQQLNSITVLQPGGIFYRISWGIGLEYASSSQLAYLPWEHFHKGFTSLYIIQILGKFCYLDTLWRHQMQTFYVVLALCAGNEFPSQGPVTGSFDVFFHLCLNNNHEAGDLRSHRAHYDVIVMWNDWIRWQLWTCQGSWALITCMMATWCAQYFWCKCHMCFDNIGFTSLWYVYEIDPWSLSLGCVVVGIVNGPPPMICNRTMRHTIGNLWYGQINDYLFVSITD